MRSGLWLVGMLAMLAACGSSSSGSCQVTTAGTSYCSEYSGSNVSADVVRTACTGSMGTYGASGCAAANRVGRCTYSAATLSVVSSFYSPTTAMAGQQICTLLMGTWAAN